MVLLTGATGFLGSFVLEELLRREIEVIALFRGQVPIAPLHPCLHWIYADFAYLDTLHALQPASQGIIHLACTLSSRLDEVLSWDLASMEVLLEKWRSGVFVYCSSTDVYGPLQAIPAGEDHPLAPKTGYGWGKVACEMLLQDAAGQQGRSDFVIFRPPYILGWHPRFASSLIGRLSAHILAHGDLALPDDLSPVAGHSWVAADELARWIVSAWNGSPSGIFNVCSDYTTWSALTGMLLERSDRLRSAVTHKGPLAPPHWGVCREERRFSTEKFTRAYGTTPNAVLGPVLDEICAGIIKLGEFP